MALARCWLLPRLWVDTVDFRHGLPIGPLFYFHRVKLPFRQIFQGSWLISLTVWIMCMCMQGQASLWGFPDKFQLYVSPQGAVKLVACRYYTRPWQGSTTSQPANRPRPPPSMTAFVFLPCVKHMRMRCVFSGACARLRSRAIELCPWWASWTWTRCLGLIFNQINESNRLLWHTIPSMQMYLWAKSAIYTM
jgi:hypothetical protein